LFVAGDFANSQLSSQASAPSANVRSTVNSESAEQARQIASTETPSKVATENDPKVNFSQVDTINIEVSSELEQAVSDLEDFASQTNLQLAFNVDEKTDKQVVELKDKESGDVIRQIPSQELLDIAAQVKQITSENGSAVGLLVNGNY